MISGSGPPPELPTGQSRQTAAAGLLGVDVFASTMSMTKHHHSAAAKRAKWRHDVGLQTVDDRPCFFEEGAPVPRGLLVVG
jgi:hypothetical protein